MSDTPELMFLEGFLRTSLANIQYYAGHVCQEFKKFRIQKKNWPLCLADKNSVGIFVMNY